jgi:hypothetical protein
MSRIDDLKPDQRAALQLLLKQGRSYDEIAQMLRIETRAVRERARAALDALGPEDADDLPLEDQDDVADYLLGQQSASRRAATRELLERSAPARAWARTVASELRPLAGDTLPEIPAEGAEVDEAFGALQARTEHREKVEKSSRVGGAILLGALALLIAGIIIIAFRGDGDESEDTASTGTTGTQTQAAEGGAAGGVRLLSQANLNPPQGGGDAAGVAFYSREGENGKFGVAVQAEGLEPSTENRFYAIWLTGPNTGNRFVGFDEDGVARDGILQGARELDYDPRKYTTALVTRETQAEPKQPGETVLRGRFQEVPADAQDGQPGPGAAQPPAEGGGGGAQAPEGSGGG